MNYEQWKDECPECGDSLTVTYVTLAHSGDRVYLGTALQSDGFEVPLIHDDGSTEEELVVCDGCAKEFTLSDLELT